MTAPKLGFHVRSGKTRSLGVALAAGAVLSLVAGLVAFQNPQTEAFGWLPYCLSGLLYLGACAVLIPYQKSEAALPRLRLGELVALVFIVGVAAFMRLYRLDSLPFGTWIDEADIGLIASRILQNPEYRPLMVDGIFQPLHFFSYVAVFIQLFGTSIESVRLATITLGVATVVLAFLVGREGYGRRFGLVLAFLFAISRWHVTFSRFGVYTITVPFFELLVIWFLLRARRTGQLHEFAVAGLALGLAVNFYIAARLLVALFAVFMAHWLVVHWLARRTSDSLGGPGHSSPRLVAGFAAFIVGACFTAAPIIQYALAQPQLYWGRSVQVSIFVQRDQPDLWQAIGSNTSKHLLMFNYKGDNNGRHNLPGEPMLDPVTGALLVVGAVLTITRPRHSLSFLMLASFVINLMGGVLSLDFEAPQGSRAFGAITAVLFFASVAVEAVWRAALTPSASATIRRFALPAASIGLASYAIFYNSETYFVRQANNERSWLEFGGIQAMAAERMLQADPAATHLFSSVFLANHLAIQFLAPEAANATILIPPNGFPLRISGDQPAGIFADPDNRWIVDEARKFYPGAHFTTDYTPSGQPALYSVLISPEDLQQLNGVSVSYWTGEAIAGAPALTYEQATVDSDWQHDLPMPIPFTAQWRATWYVPKYANYELRLSAPSHSTLWVDGQSLSSSDGEHSVITSLAEGDHALQIEAAGKPGTVYFSWRELDSAGTPLGEFAPVPAERFFLPSKVPAHGLLGTYYEGESTASPLAFKRVDSFVDMYIHIIPLPRPYTVEWTGQIYVPRSGTWAIGLRIRGLAEVHIDGQMAINAQEPQEYVQGQPLNLTEGWHSLTIVFKDIYGGSRIHLYWVTPEGEVQVVPREALIPYP